MHQFRRLAAAAVVAAAVTAGFVSAPTAGASPVSTPPPTSTIDVGSNPYDVAVSQSLGKAFVVNDGAVSVLSLLTHRKIAEFSTGGYQGQNAVALVRGNRQGYIANYETSTVAVFDTETHKVVRQIPIGGGAVDVVKANTPRGQRAYLSVLKREQIVGVQTSTGKVVQRIKLPAGASTLSARPGGKTIWAGSVEQGKVWVVNTTTGKISRTINVDRSGPITSVAFAPGAKRAWVAGLGGVSVVDTRTGKTKKFLTVNKLFTAPPNMGAVAISGSGRYAFVQDSTAPDRPDRGVITIINTRTYKVVWRIRTGVQPWAIALDTRRDVAYVPNYLDDTVTIFAVPN